MREFDYKGVFLSMQGPLAGDYERRLTFLSSHDSEFANAFPFAFAPGPLFRFNSFEFGTDIARKLSLQIPLSTSRRNSIK